MAVGGYADGAAKVEISDSVVIATDVKMVALQYADGMESVEDAYHAEGGRRNVS